MAKYGKIGDKYYTVGEASQLQQISEQDIIGRRGDVPGGKATIDFIRKEGDIQDIDPSRLSFDPKGAVMFNGQNLALGGSGAYVKPGTTIEQFGGLPFNQDFSEYLKSTGQTYGAQGFSGGGIPSTQATLQGQQAGTISPITGQPIAQPGAVLGQQGAIEGVY